MSLQPECKKVAIMETEFSSASKFVEFVETFRNTVDTFVIYFVLIKQNDFVAPAVVFPKLKQLQILVSDDVAYHLDCPEVESLNILPKSTK